MKIINKSFESSQPLLTIIDNIVKINELQSERVSVAGFKSENYKNFTLLKEVATVDELVQLTDHENATVACYASWALVTAGYSDVKTIFQKFVLNDKLVTTYNGCIKEDSCLSTEFYLKYWCSINTLTRTGDEALLDFDHIILYSKVQNYTLLDIVFQNRVFDKSCEDQIAYLAFHKGYREAVFYLCDWYRGKYADKIKEVLKQYLDNTNFTQTGMVDYYRCIKELFKFKDTNIRKKILTKIQEDRCWENKEEFISLLRENGIYDVDN